MDKWEYSYEYKRFDDPAREMDTFLNRKGSYGWELVNFLSDQGYFFSFVFKREVQ